MKVPRWLGLVALFALGAFSHASSGVYSFIVGMAKGALDDEGVKLVFLVYAFSTMYLFIAMGLFPKFRREFGSGVKQLVFDDRSHYLKLMVLFFSVSAMSFYLGVPKENVAHYQFFTRLTWILAIPVGVIFLSERVSWTNVLGVALAFLGGILIWEKGMIAGASLYWGLTYIVAASLAYLMLKKIYASAELAISVPVALVLRTIVVTVVAGVLYLSFGRTSLLDTSWEALWKTACVAMILLGGIFYCRFLFLERADLWRFGALCPIQALAASIWVLRSGASLQTGVWIALGLIVAGEVLVNLPSSSSKSEYLRE